MSAFLSWLYAFVFTQIVEVPIYRRTTGCSFLVAFGASAMTHPIVWFAFPRLPLPFWWMVATAETFAVIAEALYLWFFRLPRPLLWSLVANGSSAGLGLLSRHFFGLP